jgi:hypothetical protein
MHACPRRCQRFLRFELDGSLSRPRFGRRRVAVVNQTRNVGRLGEGEVVLSDGPVGCDALRSSFPNGVVLLAVALAHDAQPTGIEAATRTAALGTGVGAASRIVLVVRVAALALRFPSRHIESFPARKPPFSTLLRSARDERKIGTSTGHFVAAHAILLPAIVGRTAVRRIHVTAEAQAVGSDARAILPLVSRAPGDIDSFFDGVAGGVTFPAQHRARSGSGTVCFQRRQEHVCPFGSFERLLLLARQQRTARLSACIYTDTKAVQLSA